jgi:YD repeat-containing protein
MKNKFLSILLLCIPILGISQPISSDWEKMGLKGKVKMLYEYRYKLAGDQSAPAKGTLIDITQYVFNNNGLITEEILNDAQMRPVLRTAYAYNGSNLLIGKDVFYGAGKSRIQKRFNYDKDGRLLGEQEFMLANLIITTAYKYNAAGQLTEKNLLHLEDPDQTAEYKFTYDDKGNMTEKSIKKAGVKYTRENYSYDDKGMLINKTYAKKKSDPEISVSYKYEFDDKGNWINVYQVANKPDWTDNLVLERKFEFFEN